MRRKPITLLLVLVVMTCFAANSVATRFVVSRGFLDPAAVTIARFAAGAAMLALAGALVLAGMWLTARGGAPRASPSTSPLARQNS